MNSGKFSFANASEKLVNKNLALGEVYAKINNGVFY